MVWQGCGWLLHGAKAGLLMQGWGDEGWAGCCTVRGITLSGCSRRVTLVSGHTGDIEDQRIAFVTEPDRGGRAASARRALRGQTSEQNPPSSLRAQDLRSLPVIFQKYVWSIRVTRKSAQLLEVRRPSSMPRALSVNKSTASQSIQRTQMSANGLTRTGSFPGTTSPRAHTLRSFDGVPPPRLLRSRARVTAMKT